MANKSRAATQVLFKQKVDHLEAFVWHCFALYTVFLTFINLSRFIENSINIYVPK